MGGRSAGTSISARFGAALREYVADAPKRTRQHVRVQQVLMGSGIYIVRQSSALRFANVWPPKCKPYRSSRIEGCPECNDVVKYAASRIGDYRYARRGFQEARQFAKGLGNEWLRARR